MPATRDRNGDQGCFRSIKDWNTRNTRTGPTGLENATFFTKKEDAEHLLKMYVFSRWFKKWHRNSVSNKLCSNSRYFRCCDVDVRRRIQNKNVFSRWYEEMFIRPPVHACKSLLADAECNLHVHKRYVAGPLARQCHAGCRRQQWWLHHTTR